MMTPPPAHEHVVRVDPLTDSRWDSYISAHPQALVYHHSGWLHCLMQESRQRPFGLAVEDADRSLRGVLPLVATRGLPLPGARAIAGRRLSSLPRTPLAGPLADGRA